MNRLARGILHSVTIAVAALVVTMIAFGVIYKSVVAFGISGVGLAVGAMMTAGAVAVLIGEGYPNACRTVALWLSSAARTLYTHANKTESAHLDISADLREKWNEERTHGI